ncbi:PaaI family thioesterase [Gordonia humi]|uniref:Acyl-coenzyme A thioesterase THEM4 n=1 Tax=Gordonia humi TaxID=686429 RepID=A0A840F0P4_9ACTN|nr:PaaI family thioesterase [Gordonia humi]MBB4134889.1 acyl-coenzyme A thioesterase PaaI-like protein [Gordonia humi]
MEFRLEDIDPDEIERRLAVVEPLTDSVRGLIDAVIRSEVDDAVLDRARARIDEITAELRVHQKPGGYGTPFTRDLRGMPWGNAATGLRNPIAPPLRPEHGAGVSTGSVHLGAAYEGPGGLVHGGVLALLMDQLVGECASTIVNMPHFTGTLTVRYLRPTKLGRVDLRAEVTGTQDRKTFVHVEVRDREGVTADGEAIMIRPKDFPGRDEVLAAIARTP